MVSDVSFGLWKNVEVEYETAMTLAPMAGLCACVEWETTGLGLITWKSVVYGKKPSRRHDVWKT